MIPKYKLYRKAWLKWGERSQLDMVIEECSELIKAIQKYKRKGDYSGIQEEAADVEIMIEQLREMYDYIKINEIKKQKLVRLEKLVKE